MDTLRAKEAQQHGLSPATLRRHAQRGEYEQLGRGIYRRADASPADLDLIEAATRRPDAIICLTSALAHYELIDDIPHAIDLAIPRNARRPATHGPLRWHRFDLETFELGRRDFHIAGSDRTLGIYSPERCIADAFRLRSSMGYETGPEALRTWVRRGGQPSQLIALAKKLPRATRPLLNALTYLA